MNGDASRAHGKVSVITLSSRGPTCLRGAIETIAGQDYRGPIEMIVVGDNARWNQDRFKDHEDGRLTIRCFSIRTDQSFVDLAPVERVARLRNIGLTLVEGAFFCFLDDDNRWEREHISTLVAGLEQSKARAAHSWRQLHDHQGRPWIADRFPWICDRGRAVGLFRKFTAASMLSTSDPIFRDAAKAIVDGEDVGAVDMGAWLFRRDLLGTVRFETAYSAWEVRNSVTEDDKLLARLKSSGIRVACSRRPTLKYYLGGYSNTRQNKPALSPHSPDPKSTNERLCGSQSSKCAVEPS